MDVEENKQDQFMDYLQLSPRQVYPAESLDNFFICKVCLKVVQEAKECTQCQTAFCGNCVSQWIDSQQSQLENNKHISCPLRCKSAEFRDLHRYASQSLKQIQFKCNHDGCDQVFAYDEAIKHQEFCPKRQVQCECGLHYLYGDIAIHSMECNQVKDKCRRCDIVFRYQQKDQHDCLVTYKGIIQQQINSQKKYERNISVQCPSGHCLYPQVGPAEFHIKQFGVKGGNTTCDNCRKQMLQKDKLYWRCNFTCDFDICHKCLYTLKR